MIETENGPKLPILVLHQPITYPVTQPLFPENWNFLVVLILHTLLSTSSDFSKKPFAWYCLRIKSMRQVVKNSEEDGFVFSRMAEPTSFKFFTVELDCCKKLRIAWLSCPKWCDQVRWKIVPSHFLKNLWN